MKHNFSKCKNVLLLPLMQNRELFVMIIFLWNNLSHNLYLNAFSLI